MTREPNEFEWDDTFDDFVDELFKDKPATELKGLDRLSMEALELIMKENEILRWS
jgi:hypothetical protein